MGMNWSKDIDQTLAAAKEQSRPSVAGQFGHEVIRR